jgi:hypothetical protein
MGKTKFKLKSDMVTDFIDMLSDLTDISDSIKLKIDNENIMMYSTLGGGVLLAFKNFLVKTKDYFDMNDDLENPVDVIILNAKKFVKNLNFLKESEKVSIDITHKPSQDDDDIMVARSIQIIGGKLKVNWIAGEHYEIRDINKSILDDRLNLKHRKWNFNINKQDFNDIKKLSSINDAKILNITVSSGKVSISENAAWELEVDVIDKDKNTNLILNKKFLKCIDDTKDVDFSIFENFMLVKDEKTNLMLSFEQTFDED